MKWWWLLVGLTACGPGANNSAPGPLQRDVSVGTSAKVTALTAAPDGQRIAVGQNGALDIRGADGAVQQTLMVQPGFISALAWSADGQTLFGGGQANGLTSWNAMSGAVVHNLTDTVFPVRAVAVNSAGLVAAAMGDNTIRTYGSAGSELQRWLQQAAALQFVDEQTLLSGGADGYIRRMDAGGGASRGEFNAHLGGVIALATANGKVASVGYDGVIRLSTVQGQELFTWTANGTLLNVALVADGHVVAGTAEGELLVGAQNVAQLGREELGSPVTALCAAGQGVWAGTEDARLLHFLVGR